MKFKWHWLFAALFFIAGCTDIPIDDFTPDVDPDVDPAPIALEGLRVLIVYETDDKSGYTEAQRDVIESSKLRTWLNDKVVKHEGHPEWRIADKDIDIEGETEGIKALMAVPRDSLPWLVVSNGKTGYSGPIPEGDDGEAAVMSIVEEHD